MNDALAQETEQPAFESQPVPPIGEQESDGDSEQHPAQKKDSAEKLLPAIQGIESAIRDLISEEDQIERERRDQREKADLDAQQDMARWAKYMLWATCAGIFLTAVGVYLIYRTLHHTRIAAEHAGKAVDEARNATVAAQQTLAETHRANEIAHNALVAQHRPWMVLEVDGAGPVRANNREVLVNIEFHAKNIGGSPAVMTIYDAKAFWTKNGNWPKMADLSDLIEKTRKQTVLYPHANVVMPNDDTKFGWVRLRASPTHKVVQGDVPSGDFGIVVSCCVLYKSMISDQWFHTAHLAYVRHKPTDLSEPRSSRDFRWGEGEVHPDDIAVSISKAGGTSSIA